MALEENKGMDSLGGKPKDPMKDQPKYKIKDPLDV